MRPWPKGCSESGFFDAILNPSIETREEAASDRLLKASAVMATEPARVPAINFAAKRTIFRKIPNVPHKTPYAVLTDGFE